MAQGGAEHSEAEGDGCRGSGWRICSTAGRRAGCCPQSTFLQLCKGQQPLPHQSLSHQVSASAQEAKAVKKPGQAGERPVGIIWLLGDSYLKNHSKVWKYPMNSGILKVSAQTPLLPVLQFCYCWSTMLAPQQYWKFEICLFNAGVKRELFEMFFFYTYIFLVNLVALMFVFGC